MEASLVKEGVLAGLADERLVKAMMATQAQPEVDWTLEALAGLAAMSRSRFAKHFLDTVGATAMDCLCSRVCAPHRGFAHALGYKTRR